MVKTISIALLLTLSHVAGTTAQHLVDEFIANHTENNELTTVNIDKAALRLIADLKEGDNKAQLNTLSNKIKTISIYTNRVKGDSLKSGFDSLSTNLLADKGLECILNMHEKNEMVTFFIRRRDADDIAEFIMVSVEPNFQTLMRIKGQMKLSDIAQVSALMNFDLSNVVPVEHN